MYLPPEQKELRANATNLKNKRTQDIVKMQQDKIDIYAAGIVLFEMCGNFRTDMERCSAMEHLEKRRQFPKGFTEKFYQESKIIYKMTEPLPAKRFSAASFCNKSPEFSCYKFDLKMGGILR